jgi:hypothetical protein
MFHKWRSIENYERIDKDLLNQVECDLFYVTEKLDGCNVCICNKREVIGELNWNESWVVRSRNGGDFSENADVKVAMKKIEPFLEFLRVALRYDWNRDFREIVIYGELINSKLLHRIWYGDKTPQIRLFGLSYFYPTINRWIDCTIEQLFKYAHLYQSRDSLKGANIDTQQYFVPIIGEKKPLLDNRAVSYLYEIDIDKLPKRSKLSVDGTIEGYVLHNIDWKGCKILPFIKWKTKEFSECIEGYSSRRSAEVTDQEREIKRVQKDFARYFTLNRAYSVLSKHSDVSVKDLSALCREFFDDAKEDYLKDHPELLNHPDEKKMFKGSSSAFLLLKEAMKNVQQ